MANDRPDESGLQFSVRDLERDEEERHREAVIEPALHIQRLPHPDRHRRAGDHLVTQRRVGRGQHRGEQEHGGEGHGGEDERPDPDAGEHREWQPDQQEPLGPPQLATQGAEVEPRGIAEQQQDQRHLGHPFNDRGFHGGVEKTERGPASQEARDSEEQGRGDPMPVQRPGEGAPDDDERQDRRCSHHASPTLARVLLCSVVP
nr:hypothetical protein [Nesterenkonia sandarakina]